MNSYDQSSPRPPLGGRFLSHWLITVSPDLRWLGRLSARAGLVGAMLAASNPARGCNDGDVCTEEEGETFCCSSGEGANVFSVHDGDATRTIYDLRMTGASRLGFGALGSGRLAAEVPAMMESEFVWARYHHTVPREGAYYFGVGGSWRHNWQYDLAPLPEEVAGEARLALVYPSGLQRIFRRDTGGRWAPAARYLEKLTVTSDGMDITLPEGQKLQFVESKVPNAPHKYEMRTHLDAYGAATRFEYGEDGWLRRVTDPFGRWFELDYTKKAHQRGLWHSLGKVAAPPAGEWIEFTVDPKLAKSFRHLRLRALKDGPPPAVAELQFFAPGSKEPLRGTANGTGERPETLFDGDVRTVFSGTRSSSNVCGLELGSAGASPVERIRLLPAPGSSLAGAVLEGLEFVPGSRAVVTKVTGSNGSSVSYQYDVKADPVTSHEFVVLREVGYGDGTAAKYQYAWPRANTRPLLVEADDPRYAGGAKRIRYSYHDQLGMIHQEINPATGAVFVSLELDPRNADKRTIHYSDLRVVTYLTPVSTNGRPVERTDALGRKEQFEYADNGAGRLSARTDHTGRRTEYTYDQNGRLIAEVRDQRPERLTTWDAAGRTLSSTDRQGRTTRYRRDGNGRVDKVTFPDGTEREFILNSQGSPTEIRERDGAIHRLTYNDRGLLTTWTDPTGGVARYTYDRAERNVAISTPVGGTILREFNERGLLTKVTNADSRSQVLTYDAYGRAVQITDEMQRTTKFGYDDLSRIVRVELPAGGVGLYGYGDILTGCSSCSVLSRPTRIVSPDGSVTSRLYDGEGRLLAETVAVGTKDEATTTYGYDDDDNITIVTSPTGAVTRMTYDADRRLLTSVDPLNATTRWSYDRHDNVSEVESPDGTVIRHEYDQGDRRTATLQPDGSSVRFLHDAAGRMLALTDARKNEYRFTYDAAGRKTAMSYPDGTTEKWSYDPLGRVVTYTTRGGETKSTSYDLGSHPLKESWGAASPATEVSYSYNALGQLVSVRNPVSTVAYTYDANGRVASETTDLSALVPGLAAHRVQYGYDPLGRRLRRTDPDGTVVNYRYSATGRLDAVDLNGTRTLASYVARPDGLLTSVTRANGVSTEYGYDAAGHLLSMVTKKGPKISASLTYQVDRLGRPIRRTSEEGRTETYAYNLNSELTSVAERTDVAGTISSRDYRYDAAGNREITRETDSSLAVKEVRYGVDASNRYVSVGADVKLGHDGNGNMKSVNGTAYVYDAQNRLVRLETSGPGAKRLELYYDGLNRCVVRKASVLTPGGSWQADLQSSVAVTYDTDWRLVAMRRLDGSGSGRYVHGTGVDDVIMAGLTGADGTLREFYPLTDRTGSTVALADREGEVVRRFRYDAFGTVAVLNPDYSNTSAGAGDYPLLFQGREMLLEGIYDFRNRAYESKLGRFLQPDPLRFDSADWNLYRFAQNSPLVNTDPYGLITVPCPSPLDLVLHGGLRAEIAPVDLRCDLYRRTYLRHTDLHLLATHMNDATFADLFAQLSALKAGEAVYVSTDKAVKCALKREDSALLLFFYTFKSPKAKNEPLETLSSLTASGVKIESLLITGKNDADSRGLVEREFARRRLRIKTLQRMATERVLQVKAEV